MTNIPTDLLRTLVAVVDFRSFTKAAASLGLTQPAVSAQIKRLQFLLGGEVFDRSVQGISLTQHGEMVVSYARRLLSINDQIVHLGGGAPRTDLLIRVGSSSDYVGSILPGALGRFRERWPDVRFVVRREADEPLLRELRSGMVDVVVALSANPPPPNPHRGWADEVVWVRSAKTPRLDKDSVVPLVSYGEPCAYHRLAVSALKAVGRQWEDVFTGPSLSGLAGAVTAGLGVMPISRRIATSLGLTVWEEPPLPKLAPIHFSVYVREGVTCTTFEQLADEIVTTLQALVRAPKLVAVDPTRKASPAA